MLFDYETASAVVFEEGDGGVLRMRYAFVGCKSLIVQAQRRKSKTDDLDITFPRRKSKSKRGKWRSLAVLCF